MGHKEFGVCVVGLGRFGSKRVSAVAANPRSHLSAVSDVLADRAHQVGAEFDCASSVDWAEVVARRDVNIVVVSTTTRSLPQVALAALRAGKHVLCEKPFGRNSDEVLPAVEEAEGSRLSLKVGYNHRYHPALARAHELLEQGALGRLHFMRCIYGHGGREGYDQEWRSRAEMAGGGQLLDQGVHALDLFRWFAGEFSEVKACLSTAFWPIEPLEDNVLAILQAENGCLASLHASWTQWKNTFQLDVYGEKGYLVAAGLGGAYGLERLCFGQRRGLGKPPEEQWFEFPGPDISLQQEWNDFLDCIESGREPPSNGRDGWKTLRLAEAIYGAAGHSFDVAGGPAATVVSQSQMAGEHTE
jgi:predicted dehydrogenase